MRQLAIDFPSKSTWGGRRAGAGRKPKPKGQRGVPHAARPKHAAYHPSHITMRAVRGAPMFRAEIPFRAVRAEIARVVREGFRITHFSVQLDHIHMIVEAGDKTAIARGIQRLAARIAWAINCKARRAGALWRERYHRHDLKTPSEVRWALVYVLMNHRKHDPIDVRGRALTLLDPCSSAAWFTGWNARAGPLLAKLAESPQIREAGTSPPVAPAATWLATRGWARRGLVSPSERPKSLSH
jgi:putative transposase